MDKEFKEFEKWENSVEGILYYLQTWGEATIVDQKDKELIAETLLLIPKRTRRKVLKEVVFILMHGAHGVSTMGIITQPFNKKDIKKFYELVILEVKQPIIILNFCLMEKDSKKKKMDSIAHEIAHFVLGHHKTFVKKPRGEREADDLIEKWGFKRVYTEKHYKMFEEKNERDQTQIQG